MAVRRIATARLQDTHAHWGGSLFCHHTWNVFSGDSIQHMCLTQHRLVKFSAVASCRPRAACDALSAKAVKKEDAVPPRRGAPPCTALELSKLVFHSPNQNCSCVKNVLSNWGLTIN